MAPSQKRSASAAAGLIYLAYYFNDEKRILLMGSAYFRNGNDIDRVLQSIEPIGCILNSEGIILDVSAGWKEAADQSGLQLHNYAIGANYLRHCIDRDATSLDTYRGLTRVLSG